jgi:hypothetical protein
MCLSGGDGGRQFCAFQVGMVVISYVPFWYRVGSRQFLTFW